MPEHAERARRIRAHAPRAIAERGREPVRGGRVADVAQRAGGGHAHRLVLVLEAAGVPGRRRGPRFARGRRPRANASRDGRPGRPGQRRDEGGVARPPRGQRRGPPLLGRGRAERARERRALSARSEVAERGDERDARSGSFSIGRRAAIAGAAVESPTSASANAASWRTAGARSASARTRAGTEPRFWIRPSARAAAARRTGPDPRASVWASPVVSRRPSRSAIEPSVARAGLRDDVGCAAASAPTSAVVRTATAAAALHRTRRSNLIEPPPGPRRRFR